MKVEYLDKGNETTDAFSGVMEYLDKGNEITEKLYGVMEYLDKGNETMELDRTNLRKRNHLSDETQGNKETQALSTENCLHQVQEDR